MASDQDRPGFASEGHVTRAAPLGDGGNEGAASAMQAAVLTATAAARVAAVTGIFAGLIILWPAEDFGAFMFAYVLANALAKIVDFGFVLQLNRDVARSETDAAPLVGTAFWVKVCLLAPLLVLAGPLTWFEPVAPVRTTFALLLASEAAQSFALFFTYPLRGLGRYAAEARVTLVSGALLVAVVSVTLFMDGSVEGAAAGMLIGRVAGAAVAAGTLTRHLGGWMTSPSRPDIVAGLRTGLPFGVHVSVGALCLQTETLVLHSMLGPAATGVYQVGARLVSMALMVGDAVHTVYLRRIAKAGGDWRLLAAMARVLFFMGIAATAAFAAFASTPSLILLLGEEYLILQRVLPVLGLLVLVRFVGIPYGLSLTLDDRQSARALAVVAMAIGGALISYVAIARFGILGAPLAAVVNSVLLYGVYAALLDGSRGSVLKQQLTASFPALSVAVAASAAAVIGSDGVRVASSLVLGGLGILVGAQWLGLLLRVDRRTARNAVWRGIELLLAPLAAAAWLMPRDRQLWVFGSWNGTRFADNPRYLFEHLTAQAPGIRAVWISRRREIVRAVSEQGGEAYSWLSPRGLWATLRAGVYVFDSRLGDVNRVTVGRAERVNLWHGVPLKKIEADITNSGHPIRRARSSTGLRRLAWRMARPEFFERYDWILAPSESVAACLASAFEIDRARVIVGPYPRGDGFCEHEQQQSAPTADVHTPLTFLYAPTFRDAGNSLAQAIPMRWEHLDALLTEHGATLLVKLHPVDRRLVPEGARYRSIRFLPADEDIYATLRSTDVLITDYSSVYFDYLLLDRPMLFYAYDLDRYISNSRALYFDYQRITPGPVATDYESLARAMAELLRDYPSAAAAWASERARVRSVIHTYVEPPFSSRTAAKLQEALLAPLAGEAA